MLTPFQAKYFAHELTKRSSSEKLEKLSQSLFNATVDMNPHQVEAALFAFRSPLSRGALLADEVGLGKTIEAGLIISQLWAERRRRVLVIVPTSLRKQWNRELIDKFFIPSRILETRSYNLLKKGGTRNPFEADGEVVICSYGFARSKAEEIARVPWSLVVIDEAHRLRNVYRKNNKIARAILEAVEGRPKVLLTATPLQNNLMELYGLVRFIDPLIFGDETSFRTLFGGGLTEQGFKDLRARLRPVCHRTLRRQVAEYVPYTNRIALTQDFTPTAAEQRLYDEISEYLRRDDLQALPSGQRQLMTMVLRKLLASSSFAIAGTLQTLIKRLEANLDATQAGADGDRDGVAAEIETDFEALDETREEWADEGESSLESDGGEQNGGRTLLSAELAELKDYHNLALSITENAKGRELLVALDKGFSKLAELGARRKAVIFTESRRTQDYLLKLLSENGYADDIVLFNGSNAEPRSQQIYRAWLERHHGSDQVTGSKSADMRSALVEHFRDYASIMIATEAGAEGINLQFASLVVNYDLPWNPQRIEQRIGRCHRYGQKHDVVVINFLNRLNEADVRVFELLSEKFRLFSGVFGASDEVLGVIESGVDFERKIAEIYQHCRTPQQIKLAFDELQRELNEQISACMDDTRRKLLEHFDEEVHERLRLNREQTERQISRLEGWLWRLTKYGLRGHADFDDRNFSFSLQSLPPEFPDGRNGGALARGAYRLLTKTDDGEDVIHYRPGHPLAEGLIALAKGETLAPREVTFHYCDHETKISVIENLGVKSGWLRLTRLTVEALDNEDHLMFVAFADDGRPVDQEICERLMGVAASAGREVAIPEGAQARLEHDTEARVNLLLDDVMRRNNKFFEDEIEKIDKWADDRKQSLEIQLKDLDAEIKAVTREARLAPDLQTKIELRRRASELERARNRRRKELFDEQDKIENSKDEIITRVEARLKQTVTSETLFTIRWTIEC